jgi:hypothetical protein
VNDLYAVRPEEFVAARTALVKQLKAEGHKEEAAATAKLRRPSVAAWALNQVAREEPALVAAAIDAGRRLRTASDAAVAGRPGALRGATAGERDAANAVVKAAAAHLGARAATLTPALLATIRVAALDDEVADQLARGVLVTEQEQPGFGFGMDGEVAATAPTRRAGNAAPKGAVGARRTPPARATSPSTATTPTAADRKAAADERAAARAHKKAVAEAQRTLDRKVREARRLAKEADAADAAATTARAAADEAQAGADAAQQALDELG